MSKLKAFVGHSFNEDDSSVVNTFLKYLNTLDGIGLEWDHAEKAEPKELAIKVKEKMEDKNLFIGIFTVKNMQIDTNKIKPAFFSKNMVKAEKRDFRGLASDWVIQESGYALGLGMTTIFLVEDGLGPIGGLQGNIEHIPFARANISDSFAKLNEMLSSLVSKKGNISNETPLNEKTIEDKEDLQTEPVEQEKLEGERDVYGELYYAILEGDKEKEQQAYSKLEKFEGDGTDEKIVELKSKHYWLRYVVGKKDILDDLVSLSTEHPEHPDPHRCLGRLFEDYKQYDKASEHFIEASEFSRDEVDKAAYICRAATALVSEKKHKEGKKLLLDYTMRQGADKLENFHIYKTLANIQKETDNYEQFFSLAEKAIELKPGDSGLRFDLAYAYSKKKKHIMALHHYNILCNSHPTESNWNNNGVELSELKLEGKSVSAYLQSKALGGTTAVGNLAYKLMDAGYYEMANESLHEALKNIDSSSHVSSALSNLEKRIEKEDTDEKELLLKSSSEIKFRVRYAEAYTIGSQDSIPTGRLKCPHGEINVSVTGNKLKAFAEFEVSLALGIGSMVGGGVLGGIAKPKANVDIKTVDYDGVLINGIVDYTLTVTSTPIGKPDRTKAEGANLAGILALRAKVTKFNGQMILGKDGKSIDVMEMDDKGKVDFYTITEADKGGSQNSDSV